MGRVNALDYLRGLAAFGILLYHYQSWTFGNFDADSFWGRVGLYGVAIFYVLSGLTLYHVYEQRLKPCAAPLADFYIKRVFRLFPLLWIIFTIYLVREPVSYTWGTIILNYTGLFGLFDWDNAIGVGVWSIGNELVFYLFFPLFLFLSKYNKHSLWVVALIIFACSFYFAFLKIDPSPPLADQWRYYTNPLNQIFLFFSGFAIGYLTRYKPISNMLLVVLLISSLLAFSFYPATGETSVLVSGIHRFLFAAFCLLICLCLYKLPLNFPAAADRVFTKLGEISYALYLLHPVVYKELVLAKINNQISPWLLILLAAFLSILLSLLIFHFYEKPFIRLGQKTSYHITQKLVKQKPVPDLTEKQSPAEQ